MGWEWQTIAAVVTAVATIIYTIGTFLLWRSTRNSVHAMENAVKLTFLQMLYETKRPSGIAGAIDPSEIFRVRAERGYQKQYEAALQQTFPELYAAANGEEQGATPGKRQERS